MPNFPNICKIAQMAEGATTIAGTRGSGFFIELTSESAHMKNKKIVRDPTFGDPRDTFSPFDPRGDPCEPPGV